MQLLSDPVDGDVIDMYETMYPTTMTCRTVGGAYRAPASSTSYAICYSGNVTLRKQHNNGPDIRMQAGSVAAFWGSVDILPNGSFVIFFIEKLGYRGLRSTAQCEERGRLAYIDGCSDTTLIPPARYGDPALNFLHFPPNIDQTQHLHPDIRMGVVLRGKGVAWQGTAWEKDMTSGAMFCVEESEIHSFKTEKSLMDVIAYHPTSNTGPTDEAHAMISRTYINHGKT